MHIHTYTCAPEHTYILSHEHAWVHTHICDQDGYSYVLAFSIERGWDRLGIEDYFYIFLSLCMSVYRCEHSSENVHKIKRIFDPQKLESQEVVGCLMVPETEFGS